MRLKQARAIGGLLFVAAFAAALLADVLIPNAQLTQTHLAMFAATTSALLGIDIATNRWSQLVGAITGAVDGARAASEQQQSTDATEQGEGND